MPAGWIFTFDRISTRPAFINPGLVKFVPIAFNIDAVHSVHDVGDEYYRGKNYQEYFLWCEYMQLHYNCLQKFIA